jgi:flagellar assembly protein FliH
MGAAPRYLFDRSFEPGRETPPPEVVLRARLEAQHRAEIEAARNEALAEGEARGRAAAAQATEAEIAGALDLLLSQSADLVEQAARETRRLRTESAALALTAASRLAAELVRRAPHAETEALFAECIAQLDGAPRIVVHAPRRIAGAIETRLSALASAKGFAGQVSVLPDDAMTIGDCRIEWAEGGAARDWRKLVAAIDGAVKRHLNAEAAAPAQANGVAA